MSKRYESGRSDSPEGSDYFNYDSVYYNDDDSDVDYGYDETDVPLEPCPNCGEEIYEDAQQCPYCGEYVVADSRSSYVWNKNSRIWVTVGILGVIATIIVLVLNL